MNSSRIFWLLTIAVASILLLPSLLQKGMFLDGITYGAISKNLANGIGYFTSPKYTDTLYPQFHEHPPFVFWLQSLFFKILGNGFYVERIYSLFIFLLTTLGIKQLWKLIVSEEYKKHSWLPVLLWMIVPIISWSFNQNMLENTLSLFTLFSVISIVKGIKTNLFAWTIIGSSLIVLGFLSKGFVALFPLIIPMIFSVTHLVKRAYIHQIILIFSLSIQSLVIYLKFPFLVDNLTSYLQQQLLPALQGQREITTHNRFSILGELALELLIPIAIIGIFIMITKSKKTLALSKNKPALIFNLVVGLSASIPLIVTLKQRKFYLVPSIIYFSTSIAIFIVPIIDRVVKKMPLRLGKILSYLFSIWIVIVSIFSIYSFENYSRDEAKIKDLEMLVRILPPSTILRGSSTIYNDWSLHAYLARMGTISLTLDKTPKFYLIEKSKYKKDEFREFSINGLDLTNYILLQK